MATWTVWSGVVLSSAAVLALCARADSPSVLPASDLPLFFTENAAKPTKAPSPSELTPAGSPAVERLLGLQHEGRLEQFVAEALSNSNTAESNTAASNTAASNTAASNTAASNAIGDPQLNLLRTEALLAAGRAADAERSARETIQSVIAATDAANEIVSNALQQWTTARLRQAKPLADIELERELTHGSGSPAARQQLGFWREQLAGRPPYRIAPGARAAHLELRHSTVWTGLVAHRVEGIAVSMNGVPMPLAFLDTGGQHTLMTTAAAQAAGIELGPDATELVGFSSFAARPGLVRKLQIGELTFYDVPVMVGDSPAMKMANGQIALAIDLMHHVRFTIDYPHQTVLAEPASGRSTSSPRPGGTRGEGRETVVIAPPACEESSGDSPTAIGSNDDIHIWRIPLWTFSQTCLAEGRLPAGPHARLLVDTGNRAGTFVSSRWAARSLAAADRQAPFELDRLEIGDSQLYQSPVHGTIPQELARLDAVDILLGRDMLDSYRVTIDLGERELRLVRTREPLMSSP